MKIIFIIMFSILTVGLGAFSSTTITPGAELASTTQDSGFNVVLITLDGVRSKEFFRNSPDQDLSHDREMIFPFLWNELAQQSTVFGSLSSSNRMFIANAGFVSLPAYYSILSGIIPICLHNECGMNPDESFLVNIKNKLNLNSHDVAAFSSWTKIRDAVGKNNHEIVGNFGIESLDVNDPQIALINQQQQVDLPPWSAARWDTYTHALAKRYFEIEQPRLIFVSYNDSDEWGHKVEYDNYVDALRTYDQYIKDWYDLIQTPPYQNNTCLFITTDHGRGDGAEWRMHTPSNLSASEIFMLVHCPSNVKIKNPNSDPSLITHLAIRPSIEEIFGVKPSNCLSCGDSIAHLD